MNELESMNEGSSSRPVPSSERFTRDVKKPVRYDDPGTDEDEDEDEDEQM